MFGYVFYMYFQEASLLSMFSFSLPRSVVASNRMSFLAIAYLSQWVSSIRRDEGDTKKGEETNYTIRCRCEREQQQPTKRGKCHRHLIEEKSYPSFSDTYPTSTTAIIVIMTMMMVMHVYAFHFGSNSRKNTATHSRFGCLHASEYVHNLAIRQYEAYIRNTSVSFHWLACSLGFSFVVRSQQSTVTWKSIKDRSPLLPHIKSRN